MFQNQMSQDEYIGRIDEERVVVLDQEARQDLLRPGPESNYAALQLRLMESDRLVVDHTIARRPGSPDAVHRFRFGGIEGRTDESRQRVWLVDSETRRVIATLDCSTGNVTGPDDPQPAWATSEGGVVLSKAERPTTCGPRGCYR
jgi:hypothetical protein